MLFIFFLVYLLISYYLIKKILLVFNIDNRYIYLAMIISIMSLLSFYIFNNTSIIRYLLNIYIFYIIIIFILYLLIFIINKIIHHKLNKIQLIYILLISLIITLYGALNALQIDIKEYKITNNKLNNKYNIVMISDMHLGSTSKINIYNTINKINNLDPDIIFILGDTFNNKIENVNNINDIINAFNKLKPKYGTYAVIGNHEIDSLETINKFYRKCNITLLLDEYIIINNELVVFGRIDIKRHERKEYSNIKINNLPVIILDHNPINIYYDVFLSLYGHTHNGQIFPFNLMIKPLYKSIYGYSYMNNTNNIITSGIGTWGIPIRIFKREEIVNIKIN